MRALGALAVAAIGLGGLGCGGLFAPPDPVLQEGAKDAEDPVEQMRLRGDFVGAEAELRRRLNANQKDAHSWRMLGDVAFTRGQFYQARWKENLAQAWDAYRAAITLEPTSCLTWGRLAATAVSAAENPETRIPAAQIVELPLDRGWDLCPKTAMFELAWAQAPFPQTVETNELAKTTPAMVEAVVQLEVDSFQWGEVFARPPIGPGAHFVVFPKSPITAGSVDGSKPRPFMEPEWITVSSFSDDRIVFLDRRFPERIPAVAVTRVTACPGSDWSVVGSEHIPQGTCGAGRQNRAASELYDETILRPTGKVFYFHPSIAPATISWDTVAEDSVRCTGGSVGRLFVDVPSCQVAYDRAIPQRRWIPATGNGITAMSQEHAMKMVDVANAVDLLGARLADELGHGRVAGGLPYSLFALSQPDLTGCKGRGLYQKARFVQGAVEFSCKLGVTNYLFREMTLLNYEIGG